MIPRGYAWNVSTETVQGHVWAGIAASVQAPHVRAGDLSERESDPGQAVQLLADWERAYGLPDTCSPLNATIQQWQVALVACIASQGGQSIAYYVAVAAALGYAITASRSTRDGRHPKTFTIAVIRSIRALVYASSIYPSMKINLVEVEKSSAKP